MSRQIFISYRRADSEGYAGWLFDQLSPRFGTRNIFRDVVSIHPGDNFARKIEESVQACDALLALIGPQWLTIKDEQGRLRLEDPNDYVRLEIAAALARDIRVIPILVQGASMPEAAALPENLKPLALRNAIELSSTRFHMDVEPLIDAIEQAMEQAERGNRPIVPLPLENVRFEKKIERIKDNISQLHTQYNQKRDGIIPLDLLLPILRGLFNRKTFDEPIAECKDKNWHDRLCATVQIEYFLNTYWDFVKDAAAAEGDDQRLRSYENVQRELRRYSQDLTGMFRPSPMIADIEQELMAGRLEEQRDQLRKSGIRKSKVPKRVIINCDTHRQAILQEIQSWPIL
jgi:hypothetical protein